MPGDLKSGLTHRSVCSDAQDQPHLFLLARIKLDLRYVLNSHSDVYTRFRISLHILKKIFQVTQDILQNGAVISGFVCAIWCRAVPISQTSTPSLVLQLCYAGYLMSSYPEFNPEHMEKKNYNYVALL